MAEVTELRPAPKKRAESFSTERDRLRDRYWLTDMMLRQARRRVRQLVRCREEYRQELERPQSEP